jgi:hypothetical protein
MKAKMDRKAYRGAEIMGGFRLRGTKGTYRVSNRVDLPFAGNCGNKWLALGSQNQMKRVGRLFRQVYLQHADKTYGRTEAHLIGLYFLPFSLAWPQIDSR